MSDESYLRSIVEPELENGEQLLWVGKPSPNRMLIPSILPFGFGVVWTTFAVNFIYQWNRGPNDVQGPGGLFGLQGILSNLFFVPFILIGTGALLTPIWFYLKAKRTVYCVTSGRILIVQNRRSRKVESYGPPDIGPIERTERADGSGNLTFARRDYSDNDGHQRSQDIQFVGIPDVRSVEKLLRDLFVNKPQPTVASGQDSGEFDLSESPRGAWFSETSAGWTIGATTRSPIAFFLVPFMCGWSWCSLGIYGRQIAEGKFNFHLSLLGIPFVLGTLVIGFLAIMSVCGKITVTVEHDAGRLFYGVGPIGWTRSFDWSSITRFEEHLLRVLGHHYTGGSPGWIISWSSITRFKKNPLEGHHDTGSYGWRISLIGKTCLKFGTMLTEPRRYFLLHGLRKLLASRPT
jgi:hypothetical protein